MHSSPKLVLPQSTVARLTALPRRAGWVRDDCALLREGSMMSAAP